MKTQKRKPKIRREFRSSRKNTREFSELFKALDYKRPTVLKRFISESGRILPRRITRLSTVQQRVVATQIKRARFMAYLPYENEQSRPKR